ncbi:MAG: hypothetical protein H3C35_09005 [Bacteroidetes bacterium]|nr:hypothetical protein [Bacteroidota bacterium]
MFTNLYHYRAAITDILDDNSCVADIELGFNICLYSTVLQLNRVAVIKGKNNSAKSFLKKLLIHKTVTLETIENRKYGYTVEIWVGDNAGKRINVNDLLVEKKLAKYIH